MDAKFNKKNHLIVKQLGIQEYHSVWQAMQNFTNQRTENTLDEIWLVEHNPVFTQGQAGKAEHILSVEKIPIIQTDRGGQITYHGPGQLVVYFLIDLRRKKIGVRQLVTAIENSIVELLSEYGIQSSPKKNAPGVYVDEAKICSLGLRIRKGASYHGLALNIAMDLEPFKQINPCGYKGMQVTQISKLGGPSDLEQVAKDYISAIIKHLDYDEWQIVTS